MRRFAIVAVFLGLLFVSNANAEKQITTEKSITDYKIEQLQKQIDELKKDTQKSLDEKVEEKDIDNLKDRVGDIDKFGILITVLIVLIGFFAYIKARADAKEVAENVTKKWIEDEGNKQLGSIIVELQKEAQTKIDEAVKTAKEDIERQSKAEELFMKANNYYFSKEYIKAIEYFQKVIEINPQHYDAYNNMGNAYDELKEYDKAVTAFRKAIKINPQNDKAYNNMGITYRKLEKYKKAITAYKKAIKINPQRYDVYYNMGIAYYDLQDYDKAIDAYQKAIKINPQKDEAYNNNMGIAYVNLKDYNNAITAYQKAIKINPKYDKAYTNMFEVQLIDNQDFSLEKSFLLHFGENKEAMMTYEMLKILRSLSTDKPYDLTVEEWSEKYRDIKLDWGWDELDIWIATMSDGETKKKLVKAIEVFKSHKN